MHLFKSCAILVFTAILTACSSSGTSDNDVDNSVGQHNQNNTDSREPQIVATQTLEAEMPDVPTGLKGIVYTDTETEIFWDRSTDTSIINYTVSRDGVKLTTVDALSYYDNTVAPGTTYEYMLQSVNYSGIHSEPVSLFLTTPKKAPTINASNALSLLQQVATVTNGRQFGKELTDIFTTVSNGNQENLIENGFVVDSTDYDGSLTRFMTCDQQGQFSINSDLNSLPSYNGEFQNCASSLFGGESLSGNYSLTRELSKYVYNSGISDRLRIKDLVTTASNGKYRTLDGYFSYFSGAIRYWRFAESEIIFNNDGTPKVDENGDWLSQSIPFNYVAQAFEGETRVIIQSLSRSRGALENTENSEMSNEWKHELSAEFTLQSPGTGNKLISVSTPESFVATAIGACFEQGQFKITAADGSELLLDANNGNTKTAMLQVTAEGVITQETIDWNSELPLFHATPNDVYGYNAHLLDNFPKPEDCTAD